MSTRSRKAKDKEAPPPDKGRKRKELELPTEEPKKDDKDTTESTENLECGICYDKIVVQGKPNNCDHAFCFACLQTWAKTANVCPLCKRAFQNIVKTDLENPKKRQQTVKVRNTDKRRTNAIQVATSLPTHYAEGSDSDEDEEEESSAPIVNFLRQFQFAPNFNFYLWPHQNGLHHQNHLVQRAPSSTPQMVDLTRDTPDPSPAPPVLPAPRRYFSNMLPGIIYPSERAAFQARMNLSTIQPRSQQPVTIDLTDENDDDEPEILTTVSANPTTTQTSAPPVYVNPSLPQLPLLEEGESTSQEGTSIPFLLDDDDDEELEDGSVEFL